MAAEFAPSPATQQRNLLLDFFRKDPAFFYEVCGLT